MHGKGYEQREREREEKNARRGRKGEGEKDPFASFVSRAMHLRGTGGSNAPLSDAQSVPDRFVRIYTRIVLVFIVSEEVKGKRNGRIFPRGLSRLCHLKTG